MEYFQTKKKIELVIANATVAILAVVAIVTIEHNFTNVRAQADMTNHTLFVTGSATNQTKPDKVTVSLGVEITDNTAQAAADIKLQPDGQGIKIIECGRSSRK